MKTFGEKSLDTFKIKYPFFPDFSKACYGKIKKHWKYFLAMCFQNAHSQPINLSHCLTNLYYFLEVL